MPKMTIIPSSHFHPTNWSGGKTTELFIYPPMAKYSERNFDFRLSTATVEVEESIFTPLPKIYRTLMVLNGKMSLHHEDHHSSKLGRLDVDKFEGGWNTSSVGKCTDFNLMTIGKTAGSLLGLALEERQVTNHIIPKRTDWLFIYSNSGKVIIDVEGNNHIINKGDLMVIDKPLLEVINIHSEESSELVLCHITHGISSEITLKNRG